MRRLFAFASILVLFASTVQAGFIDFGLGPIPGSPGSTMNNFIYVGGSSVFVGVGAPILSVTGEGTTTNPGHLLPGVFYTITNGSLDFTTGKFLNDDNGNGWTFDKGGTITITGNIPTINSVATQLFSGIFTQQTTILDEGGNFKVIGGGFRGMLNGILADEYGIPTGSTYSGSLALLFNSNSIPGNQISNTTLNSGNIAINTTPFGGGPLVPEPASIVMLGIGLISVGLFRMRRKRAA